MQLHILNSSDLSIESIVEHFESIIWTERFNRPGDMQLIVPPTAELMAKLAEGTFLGLTGSNEIMRVHTQVIKDGKLVVSGPSLLDLLRDRVIRDSTLWNKTVWAVDTATNNGRADGVIEYIVREMCVQYFNPAGNNVNPVVSQAIPGLSTRRTMSSLAPFLADWELEIPYGPLLPAIQTIADKYSLGLRILLDAVRVGETPDLMFEVYSGLDRSSATGVVFSVLDGHLIDSQEVYSSAEYKNVAYVYAPNLSAATMGPYSYGLAFAPGTSLNVTGFDRRTLMVFADDLSDAQFAGDSPETVRAYLERRAEDALREHNRARLIDGEIAPNAELIYGRHYGLGDLIQVQGASGRLQKARITEYIRTKDAAGERQFPTISLID